MLLFVQIIFVIFMCCLTFVSIWSFILFNKAYIQLKYKNYILEKINENLFILTHKLKESSKDKEKSKESKDTKDTDDVINIKDARNSSIKK